jgi:hypothetical protein
MKKAILLLAALLGLTPGLLNAQVSKTIHVEPAGTLSTLLSDEDRLAVTDLTLTGSINRDDFNTMKNTMPALISIDLGTVQTEGDSIPGYAFSSGLQSVILPSTLTTIKDYGFASCMGLTAVTLPSSVTRLGTYAFAGCSGLKTMVIPNTVTSIGKWAFVSCTGLASLTISSSVSSIEEYTFAGCNGLQTIAIPNSVTSIGKWAFVSCTGLINISIPSSVTSIAEYAFAGCSNLSSIEMPNSVTSIGTYAFVSCTGLKTVIFSTSLDSVAMFTFAGCGSLTSVTIPPSITSIGSYAFAGCQNIDSVTILPSSGTVIRDYAFVSCQNLTTLTLQTPSVTSVGKFCFNYCPNLASLSLPSSLTMIGEGVFSNCSVLLSVTLPSSVDSLGINVFTGCPNLQSIRVNRSVPVTITPDNYAFSGIDFHTCILYVPTGSKEAYATAYRWRDFANIVEFDLELSASSDAMTIADTTGSTATFDITSNTEWRISSDQSWLSISDTMDMNNMTLVLTAEANPNTVERIAMVTITGVGIAPQTITVTQAPTPALTLSSNTLSIGAQAGSTAFLDISSNTDWTVSSDESWLTTSLVTGSGDAAITLTAEANPAAATREAIVTVSGERVNTQTVVVIQEGTPSGNSEFRVVNALVYPNPVRDVLCIDGSAGVLLNLYDAQGRFILSQKLETDQERIDVSFLSSGMYIIQLDNQTWKISK